MGEFLGLPKVKGNCRIGEGTLVISVENPHKWTRGSAINTSELTEEGVDRLARAIETALVTGFGSLETQDWKQPVRKV